MLIARYWIPISVPSMIETWFHVGECSQRRRLEFLAIMVGDGKLTSAGRGCERCNHARWTREAEVTPLLKKGKWYTSNQQVTTFLVTCWLFFYFIKYSMKLQQKLKNHQSKRNLLFSIVFFHFSTSRLLRGLDNVQSLYSSEKLFYSSFLLFRCV